MSDRPDSTGAADSAADEPRYRHIKRPEWGEAEVIERRADRCVLRFADGVERTIGKRFYHLVHLVSEPSEDHGPSLEPPGEPQEAPPATEPQEAGQEPASMDFAAQLEVFKAIHPGGFEDSGYRDRYRVRREGDRSKRQVDPLLAAAAFQLGRPAFDRPRAKRSPADVHKAVIDLLDTTSLVTAAEVATPLGEFNRRRLATFATALRNLLFGMQSFEVRLERWVEVLHHGGVKHVGWPLVTLLPALVHPREQQFVRPVVLQRLGANLGQGDHVFRKPSPEGYSWYAKVAAVAQAELTVAGLEPRDLFDVLLFANVTLGKDGLAAWERIRAER
jgi:hypothetical protein